jgi:uncharacterized membrane protein (UPF0136 family)
MSGRGPRWRQTLLLRESVANVFDPRSRHAFVVGAAAILGLAISFLLVTEWEGLESDLAELRADGRNVAVFQGALAEAPVAISVRSCAALADLPGVVRAGSVDYGESTTFAQLGPLVPVHEVSPDLVPALASHAAVIGSALVSAPGPMPLRAPDGQVLDALVAEPEPSGMAGLNSAVAIPLSGARTTTDTCVAELSRFADSDATVPLLAAALDVSGGELIAGTLLRESYDVLGAYRERPERFLPLGLAVLGGALSIVLLRTRSSELAAYRLSGTSRADLAALLLWEQTATSGVLVAFGGTGLLLQGLVGRSVQPDDFLWVWVAGLAGMVLMGGFAVLGLRGSPADLARDR